MFRKIIILGVLLCLTGCDAFKAWFAQEFKQAEVADGISRLTARHLSMIVSELNKKFESNEAHITIKENQGEKEFGKGEAIWKIKNSVINHPEETSVYIDCLGDHMKWQGKAHIISASRTMKGRLTHNDKNPVVPDPNTLSIDVHAKLENLQIRVPGDENYLLIMEGEVKFKAYPRLAQSQKGNLKGLHVVPTSNIRFENVKFIDVKATLFSTELNMMIAIEDSNLSMQAGIGVNSDENMLTGSINIFSQTHDVPSDNKGLDPNYQQEDFKKRFLCHDDLLGKVSYEHSFFESKLARPIALLNTLLSGAVAERLEENNSCGMASPQALQNTSIVGKPGSYGHTISQINDGCFINFDHYQTKPDCFGKAYLINGVAEVTTARKFISGFIISNDAMYHQAVATYRDGLRQRRPISRPQIIIPHSETSVLFSLDMKFHNMNVREVCLSEGAINHSGHCRNDGKNEDFFFTVYSAHAQAQFNPLLAKQNDPKHPDFGFCSVTSPGGQINISLLSERASLQQGEHDIHLHAEGDFELIRGVHQGRENEISGKITINDALIPFKEDDRSSVTLDPDYDRKMFQDSFTSCKNIMLPASDDDCNPLNGLAANIARLLVLSSGSVVKVASASSVSGSFASRHAVLNRKLSRNETRVMLPALRTEPINLADRAYSSVRASIDGLGFRTLVAGKILNFEGRLIRDGIRIHNPTTDTGYNINLLTNRVVEGAIAWAFDRQEIFIRPISPVSSKISLTAHVENFAVSLYRPGHADPEPHLLITSGRFSINAQPYFALDSSTSHDSPSFSIPTPVIKFEDIAVTNSRVVLLGFGMEIPLHISDAQLRAFNGRYLGEGNYIEGEIALSLLDSDDNGDIEILPSLRIAIDRSPLNKDFEQNKFNQSYVNTRNLYSVLPSD